MMPKEKQMVFEVLILPENRNYFKETFLIQKYIRKRIIQKTGLTNEQIYSYFYDNSQNLIQDLETGILTLPKNPKDKETVLTAKQKEIILQTLALPKNRNYFEENHLNKKKIRAVILQQIQLSDTQVSKYINNHKTQLLQELENKLFDTSFSESKAKINCLSRISQELGDELSINASFSNMCDY